MQQVRKKIIIALIVTMVIAAIAVYFAGAAQNQNVPADRNETPSGSIEYSAEPNQEKVQNQANPDTEADQKLSEQESAELMDEMLNSLSDLEETVDSLDDVTDSDLQIPE
jgi:flagellar basal body-associated protein FliL